MILIAGLSIIYDRLIWSFKLIIVVTPPQECFMSLMTQACRGVQEEQESNVEKMKKVGQGCIRFSRVYWFLIYF